MPYWALCPPRASRLKRDNYGSPPPSGCSQQLNRKTMQHNLAPAPLRERPEFWWRAGSLRRGDSARPASMLLRLQQGRFSGPATQVLQARPATFGPRFAVFPGGRSSIRFLGDIDLGVLRFPRPIGGAAWWHPAAGRAHPSPKRTARLAHPLSASRLLLAVLLKPHGVQADSRQFRRALWAPTTGTNPLGAPVRCNGPKNPRATAGTRNAERSAFPSAARGQPSLRVVGRSRLTDSAAATGSSGAPATRASFAAFPSASTPPTVRYRSPRCN